MVRAVSAGTQNTNNKFMKKNRDLDIGSWPDIVRKIVDTK